jgi:prepilin-type N-terminal cleavage/methylation domain-containing protein
MTLIELLVVIVILSILVAAAIPLLAPSTSERQLREAVRGLNAFIASAQARAIAQGRPYGVAIKRLSQDTGRSTPGDPLNNNGVSAEAFIVEQPAPYAGFDDKAAVQLALDNTATGGAGQVLVRFVRRGNDVLQDSDGLPHGWDPETIPPRLIRRGDIIEVSGHRFQFTDDGASFLDANGYYVPTAGVPQGTLVTRPINVTGQEIQVHHDNRGFKLTDRITGRGGGAPYWTMPTAYKVLRQPVPTSDEPYQLPEGTVIDLRASGVGDSEFFFWPDLGVSPPPTNVVDNAGNVVIMFTPEGRVDEVRYEHNCGCTPDSAVADNVYLLVGPNVPAPPPAADDKTLTATGWGSAASDEEKSRLRAPINWLRGDSTWLVIGSATGRIATIENTFVDPLAVFGELLPFGTASQPSEEMRANQIVAARRFTRDMRQLGGR